MSGESGGPHKNNTSTSRHSGTEDFELSVPLLLGDDDSLDIIPVDATAQHDLRRSKSGVYESEKDCNPLKIQNDSGLVDTDVSLPEKETIQFKVNLEGASSEVEQLVYNIKHVAEQLLYHWKTFDIILPSPFSQCVTDPTSQVFLDNSIDSSKTDTDLFIAPGSFDELDDVAFDENGVQRKLTANQLKSIRERGEFEVDSLNFPGQQHRWRLSRILQKGTENTRNSLLHDLACAARFIVIIAKDRLFSNFFSAKQAAKALLDALSRILDILVGMPSLAVNNWDAKIREECIEYLVAELVCAADNRNSLEMLCSYIKNKLNETEDRQRLATMPYRFLTPSGLELDLRLWNRSLMDKALPILTVILGLETMGWFPHFKEKLIGELKAKNISDENIVTEVNEAAMNEYLKRVFKSVLSNPGIKRLGNGIAQLLVQQAQSVVLMQKAIDNVQSRLYKAREEYTSKLRKTHPILSRIDQWFMPKLKSFEQRFSQENQWTAHEEAIAMCNSQGLFQTVYFLNRDLAFKKERIPALLIDLNKVKTPSHTFFWPTKIWRPTNWIVTRKFQGQSERIPTVISKHEPSITTASYNSSQPTFYLEKEKVRTTTTRWPLWRISNFFLRIWCWTWNAMYFFGIFVPWCSPVGLRALFLPKPFTHDLQLSQVNGTLFPSRYSITPTFISRLLSLWRNIFESRAQFEMQPDTGFIGKNFARLFHILWCYILKGPFGTIGLVVGFPVVSLLVVFVSVYIALTAVIWMPPLALVIPITNAIIYDLDTFQRNRYFVLFEILLWKIGFLGCLQLFAALFVSAICPLVAIVVFTGGVARYCIRIIWDAMLFHLIIKRGRIPASDSFTAKRISGPGLASHYFFQISPEQSLAVFEAKMEWDELEAYETVVKNTIAQPQIDFRRFVKVCFGSFSAQLAKNGPYNDLMEEAQKLLTVLHDKLQGRRKYLETRLCVTYKNKIKVTNSELNIAIQQGAMMLEKFYPSHMFPKLTCSENEFWESKVLQFRDWTGLASLLYSKVFSSDFLTPLDPTTDAYFKLKPHPHADLTRYEKMIKAARLDAGIIDVLENYSSIDIKVRSPHLKVSLFNPRDNHLGHTIEIPLPVPHPAHIVVTIDNRDSKDPIPLQSIMCQRLLRQIEDYQLTMVHSFGLKSKSFANGGRCHLVRHISTTHNKVPTECDPSCL